jgi:hypothetical protein
MRRRAAAYRRPAFSGTRAASARRARFARRISRASRISSAAPTRAPVPPLAASRRSARTGPRAATASPSRPASRGSSWPPIAVRLGRSVVPPVAWSRNAIRACPCAVRTAAFSRRVRRPATCLGSSRVPRQRCATCPPDAASRCRSPDAPCRWPSSGESPSISTLWTCSRAPTLRGRPTPMERWRPKVLVPQEAPARRE